MSQPQVGFTRKQGGPSDGFLQHYQVMPFCREAIAHVYVTTSSDLTALFEVAFHRLLTYCKPCQNVCFVAVTACTYKLVGRYIRDRSLSEMENV